MKSFFAKVCLVAASLFSYSTFNPAFAEPKCTTEPKGSWKEEKQFKADLEKEGYKIKKFKVTKGNCYEIYGMNKEGKKVEIYFNPVDGTKTKEEIH